VFPGPREFMQQPPYPDLAVSLGGTKGKGHAMASIELRLPPITASVPISRRIVSAWLDSIDPSPAMRADALVITSELVTNGVLHDGGEEITLKAAGERSSITIEVVTSDRPISSAAFDRRIADDDETGRGLAIVAALSNAVSTVEAQSRRHVRCHLAGPGQL
jgi:anti-sigma regulatory factor (Ser/Thr protein kinase)